MAKNIGANLTLKDNFTSTSRQFLNNLKGVKEATTSATGKMKDMGNSSDSLGKKLLSTTAIVGGLTMAWQGIKKGTEFLKECSDAAQKAEVSTLKLTEVMKNTGATEAQIDSTKAAASALSSYTTIGGSAARAGASQLAVFGLQADSINRLLPALGDMAVGINGVNVSQENMETLSKAVGKAMTGSTGALKKMGIVFDATSEKIIKNGTEQEKLEVITNAVEKSYGGLAKTMAENTQEGNIIMIRKSWEKVKVTIGQAVIPLITKTTKMLAENAPKIQKLILDAVAKITPAFDYFITNILPLISSGIDGILWVADKVFAGLQRGLAIISSKFEGIEGQTGGLGSAIANAFTAAQPIITWLTDVGIPLVANVIGEVLVKATEFFNFVSTNWSTIGPIVTGIATAIGTVWAIMKVTNLAFKVADGIMKGYTATTKALTLAQTWLTSAKNSDLGVSAWMYATMAKEAIVKGLIATKNLILAGATHVVTAAQWLLNAAFIASPIGWVVLGIGLLVGAFILLWKKSEGFRNFFIGMWEWIKTKISAFVDWIKPALQAVGEVFSNIWNGIKTVVVTVVSGIVTAVQWYFNLWWTVVSTVLTTIWNVVTTVWNAISSTISAIISGITGRISTAWNFIVSATTAAFTGLKNIVTGIWNGIVGAIKGAINFIIGGINKFIGGINRLQIPDWVPGVGGLSMNISLIPMLADGGKIMGSGSVLVGERGPEILNLPRGASVAPLDRESGNTTTNHNQFDIRIDATGLSVDEILHILVPKLKLAIANI